MANRLGLALTRDNAIICETEFLRFLRREFPSAGESLVTYYAPGSGRWCLGLWKDRMAGYVQEITSWRCEQELTRGRVAFIRYWLSNARRIDNKEFGRRQRSNRRRELNSLTDASRERRERARPRKIMISR